MSGALSSDDHGDGITVGPQRVRVSDLSVRDFAVGGVVGLRAVRPVTGSSWRWSVMEETVSLVGPPGTVRLQIADCWNESRRAALDRLATAAEDCGADAVIGIQIRERPDVVVAGAVVVVATGTAVTAPASMFAAAARVAVDRSGLMRLFRPVVPRQPVRTGPVMSGLSATDHAMLTGAGYSVCGMPAVTVVVTCLSSSLTRREQHLGRLESAGRTNRERKEMSRALRTAYSEAIELLRTQAAALEAEVIAVSFERLHRKLTPAFGPPGRRALMLILHATGTAITRHAGAKDPTLVPHSVLPLR